MAAPLLSVRQLTAGYDPGKPVLHDLDLDLLAGELLAVVGPNGSGKSTLIRALTGFLAAQQGRVTLLDRPLATWKRHDLARRLAVIRQEEQMPLSFTVREGVALGRYPFPPGPDDTPRVDEALAMTSLEPFADRLLSDLSGGERQRAAFARALAQRGEILLLDEATAHLDLRYQWSFAHTLRALAVREGLGILWVLHDLNLALAAADRVAVLHDGRRVALGTPSETLTPPLLREAFGVRSRLLAVPGSDTPHLVVDGLASPTLFADPDA